MLTGRVSDRNGPWLAERLRELGVDLAYTTIVGDRPEDMLAALRFMAAQGIDLVSPAAASGPPPTISPPRSSASFQGREMVLDEALEERIAEIVRPLLKRWPNLDPEAIDAANRKQAMIPRGATVLEPVGTAPGLVVPPPERGAGPTVVVLPGPPRELQPMWGSALATERAAGGDRGRDRLPRSARCGCSGSPSRRSPRRCASPSATASSSSSSRSRPA